ncbi:hypothetical protein, partial [Klebsiella aerogenes]|uniref:hypothetical protein n=1 Tax=Klebsiella aerogenes TaxID=548 RepID=UPI0019542F52
THQSSIALAMGSGGIDVSLHDTAYVVAHFHFVLSIGAILALLAFIAFTQRLMLEVVITNLE